MNAEQQFTETVKQHLKLAPYKRKCARLGKRQWNNHFYTQRDKAEIMSGNLKLINEHSSEYHRKPPMTSANHANAGYTYLGSCGPDNNCSAVNVPPNESSSPTGAIAGHKPKE